MSNSPLSNITVQQIISELQINDDFIQLPQASQIQLINSTQQEVCNLYNQAGKGNYKCDNLGDSSVLPYVRTQMFSIDALPSQDNIVTLNAPMPDTNYLVIPLSDGVGVSIVIIDNQHFNVLVSDAVTVNGLVVAI